MKKYNYKSCQSLFGYAAEVHIRCKGKCQLCGCGGEPLDFDMWRQMTVEHLIGKSQGGYLKQIRLSLYDRFPQLTSEARENLARKIDALNTVTACQFCNSTTSRDVSLASMNELISQLTSADDTELQKIEQACHKVLADKREKVKWKLESVREAFSKHVASKI